jgi:hypothetical protein
MSPNHLHKFMKINMEVNFMTRTQRIVSIALSGVLLVSGFALGKLSDSSDPKAADKPNAAATPAAVEAGSESQAFYLSDYKTGYSEGYRQGLTGEGSSTAFTSREGYNAGFKDGFAKGFENRVEPQTATQQNVAANGYAVQPVSYRPGRTRVVYRNRPVYYQARPRKSSKLRTALTIAAPAAIGAGVGALAGGKKGAGVGALIGGGGGALYHLLKNRN